MNRVHHVAFPLFVASFILSSCLVAIAVAQTPTPTPKPAGPPPLPAGMTGADVNDPRFRLTPGLYNAGEAASGIRLLKAAKKADAFQPPADPANPSAGRGGLGFANSDLAFQGNRLFQGNFYGVSIYDISNPANASLLTNIVCPGGQGDVSVYKNLLFMSVEAANGRLDCGTQGFPAGPPPAAGQRRAPPAASKDRFRGVRIFDISDILHPKQVADIQTCRGSHTHTLVLDPKDKKNVYIYVSGTSFVRPDEELAGCSGGTPDTNPATALFRIDIIKVPVKSPQDAKIISSPRIFMDPNTKAIAGLTNGGTHGALDRQTPTDQCHDITAYSAIGLAAGACEGNGILLDIRDPANPKRLDAVNDPNYSYWHSATFSNDGKKVVFTDEWGGGTGARCRPTDPNVWGADSIFTIDNGKLHFQSYYKMPAAQTDTENCVAHNGSLIPVPGRDIMVQAWYQGGISVMDFTDPKNVKEIAYFDRGPIDPNTLVLGGSWSAYWYNGHIYSSEIARGLDIFDLEPTKFLSKNEIDAAKSVKVAELNVQDQQRITWPKNRSAGLAYLDQLERSHALAADQIAELRRAVIADKLDQDQIAKIKSMLDNAAVAATAADYRRLQTLAQIIANPTL